MNSEKTVFDFIKVFKEISIFDGEKKEYFLKYIKYYNINEVDKNNRTVISYLLGDDSVKFDYPYIKRLIIEELLKNGADPNISDRFGYSSLNLAVHNNDIGMIAILLKYNADINYTYRDDGIENITVLMDCFKYTPDLIEEDIDDENGVLTTTNYKDYTVRALLENEKLDINQVNEKNENILTFSILNILLNEVLLLFKDNNVLNKLKFNHKNSNGNALNLAVIFFQYYTEKYGFEPTYKLYEELIKVCDVNNNDDLGAAPIIYAAVSGTSKLIDILFSNVDNLPDIDVQDTNHKNTAIHKAVISENQETFDELLKHNPNLELADKNSLTPLLSAIDLENLHMVKLLIDNNANKEHKDKNGKNAYDYAKECHSDEIKEMLGIELKKWKGSTKQDMELYETFFEKPNDWSNCPICLKYVERSDGCMYMAHNCAEGEIYYHKKLYNTYQFENMIEWCTVCGRITEGHKHFRLVNSESEKPSFAPLKPELQARLREEGTFVFFEDKNCMPSGGGGLEEKAARFRRLREYAKELQEDIGIKTYNEAMKELIEEVWNAPLFRTKKIAKILKDKKFNIPATNFPNNSSTLTISKGAIEEALEKNIEVLPYEGEMPVVVERSDDIFCNVMLSDREDEAENLLYRFQHKTRGGIDHENSIICNDDLETIIQEKIKNFADERFTKCFDSECNAILYPQEIQDIVPKDVYEKYSKLFNVKMITKGGKHKLKHRTRKNKSNHKNKRITKKTHLIR